MSTSKDKERTLDTQVPSERCIPEHSMHMTMPRFMEAQFGLSAQQSTHVGFAAITSSHNVVTQSVEATGCVPLPASLPSDAAGGAWTNWPSIAIWTASIHASRWRSD